MTDRKPPTYNTISFDVAATGVATLAFNRPDNFNGMNAEMSDELMSALHDARQNPDLRVLVLTGTGRAFCPGADIAGVNHGASPRAEPLSPAVNNIVTPVLLHELPVPTIAAVNGACAGAGFGLACACDIRVRLPPRRVPLCVSLGRRRRGQRRALVTSPADRSGQGQGGVLPR